MNVYCYKVNNPNKIKINVESVKESVENLYRNSKFKKFFFKKDEELPFGIIYTEKEGEVCISMRSKAKDNIERVEGIHQHLMQKKDMLDLEDNISLDIPYLFGAEQCAWWDADCQKKSGKKWKTLSHMGPYFIHLLEPYKHLNGSLIYNGKKYKLNPVEEEIASFYAKRIISEESGNVIQLLTKDDTFNSNFWSDFKTYLSPSNKKEFKEFNKISFQDLVDKIKTIKEEVLTKDQKKQKKTKADEKKRTFGYAIIDGKREAVGNYAVEPASIFYGRGNNQNRGKIKKAINPEDVIINIGKNDISPTPPPGHEWGAIVHDQEGRWLSKWKDTITNQTKYIWLSAEGKFKGQADFEKYEKAKKLNKKIDEIRASYRIDIKSKDKKDRQLGTVMYLIDIHGLRIGNEKGVGETDTVGASTLKVNNIKLKAPDHIIFDFLGKDSIQYYKDLKVPVDVYNNFVSFSKDRKETSEIFDKISAKDINEYLKQFDKDFTAKIFRTRLATEIMKKALKEVGDVPDGATKAQQKAIFRKANVKVAEILNHQRTVSKKAEERIKKLEIELKDLKKERKQKKKDGKNTDAIDKRIATKEATIETSQDTKNVAINTSLANYIDPRIIIEWITKNNVDISVVYTAVLAKKFDWAVQMTKDKEGSLEEEEAEEEEEEGSFIIAGKKWESTDKFISKLKGDISENELEILGKFAQYAQNSKLKNSLLTSSPVDEVLTKVKLCLQKFKKHNLVELSKF